MEEPTTPLARAAQMADAERADDPNVMCVGFGLKFRGGQPTFEVALQYHVHQKLATEEEIVKAGSRPVPEEVEGFATDVLPVHVVRATQCPPDKGMPTGGRGGRQENPLVGGTSSTVLGTFHSFPTGYGTLGGICFDSASGAAMALSNAHVWGTTTGLDVIQPWLPIDEYLEAAVKLILCGPLVSYILDTTVPSPLTAALTAASAGAFIAAAASDAEDPSRWGQRVGTVPPPGEMTTDEVVHVRAELPDQPFAGRGYTTSTEWSYTRETDAGSYSEQTAEDRVNEHVLDGKRAWTERSRYGAGERVQICAELATRRRERPEDFFVVAHCFPAGQPDRVVRRVLAPGSCRKPPREKPICFRGFSPPAAGGQVAWFPITEDVFQIDGQSPGRFRGPWPAGDPNPITILQIPRTGVRLTFPPCSRVEVELFHEARPIEAVARNSAGRKVASRSTGAQQRNVEKLTLQAPEITLVELSGGAGEGFLVGACVDRNLFHGDHNILRYRGSLELGLREPADRWGVALMVQTVDSNPVGGDPLDAARDLGGITCSANMASPVGCAVVMLLDHVFNVI